MLAVVLAAPPARGRGQLEHRVISRTAKKNLSPKAKAAIAGLLDDGESLPV